MNDDQQWRPPSENEIFVAPLESDSPIDNSADEVSPLQHAPQLNDVAATGTRTPRLVPLLLVTALVAGVSGGAAGYYIQDRVAVSSVVLIQGSGDSSERPAGSIAAIAAAVKPSVVSINVTSASSSGTGSGWVVDSRGYIVTNNHVIAAAANGGSIKVILNDDQSVDATIVGRNSAYDLAVLKIDVQGLKALPLGDSSTIVVGDTSVAVGSPLGLEGTVTSGIISALERPVTAGGSGELAYFSGIQTDAAINPGNSGGPLVNSKGQVIGVNSAIATTGGNYGGQSGSIGLGFAIPINTAKRVVEEIINTGASTMPIIGVQLDMQSSQDGALIAQVQSGGPAEKAGIQAPLLITEIDGVRVHDPVGLIVRVRTHAPGDTVVLSTSAGKKISVTLGGETMSSCAVTTS